MNSPQYGDQATEAYYTQVALELITSPSSGLEYVIAGAPYPTLYICFGPDAMLRERGLMDGDFLKKEVRDKINHLLLGALGVPYSSEMQKNQPTRDSDGNVVMVDLPGQSVTDSTKESPENKAVAYLHMHDVQTLAIDRVSPQECSDLMQKFQRYNLQIGGLDAYRNPPGR